MTGMLIDSEKLKQAILFTMPERSEVLLIVDNQSEGIVRCKDCRFAHLTYDGMCKQCDQITDDDDVMLTIYLPGDHYCAYGKRKDSDGDG